MNHRRLELDQDLPLQRREWLIQRIAWFLWTALIVAALVGLVGSGPLSSQQTSSTDGRLRVAYDRFAHFHNPTTLEVAMRPENETDETLRLRLSQSLLEAVDIERIEPQPASQVLSAEGAWVEFLCEPGAATTFVTFHIRHDRIGSGSGLLELAGGQNVELTYFVYP